MIQDNSICMHRAVEWDGPTTFITDADHFRLKLGPFFGSKLKIYSSNTVQQPTFFLHGRLSPMKESQVEQSIQGNVTRISHLGLHIELIDLNDVLDVNIWFEDRWVEDTPFRYRSCAELNLDLVLPETFTSYGSITLRGQVASVQLYDLDNVAFESLDLETAVGEVISHGDLRADLLNVKVETGKSELESVRVAHGDDDDSQPLNVNVETTSGHIKLALVANFVNEEEARPHQVTATSITGATSVEIRSPTNEGKQPISLPEGKKPGDLEVQTTAKTGTVRTVVHLYNEDQVLNLISKTHTGAVSALISDEFLGRFSTQTSWGSTHVQPARGSDSVIKFIRQTMNVKIGEKTKRDGGDSDPKGRIELQSDLGRVNLEFSK
ncbi:hypothetical protein BGX34_007260 [Mortierella sp. NVP85]|nr:hypothetical protein BGX34_007260 [Mortierella sp. NVP85]